MSKLVPWSRFIRRKHVDISRLLSRFNDYQEFSQWFIRMGGNPPPADEVSQYFNTDKVTVKPLLELDKAEVEETQRPSVSMKNTKVQLLEYAAAHDVVVSYYDTKAKILRQLKDSGMFHVVVPTPKLRK